MLLSGRLRAVSGTQTCQHLRQFGQVPDLVVRVDKVHLLVPAPEPHGVLAVRALDLVPELPGEHGPHARGPGTGDIVPQAVPDKDGLLRGNLQCLQCGGEDPWIGLPPAQLGAEHRRREEPVETQGGQVGPHQVGPEVHVRHHSHPQPAGLEFLQRADGGPGHNDRLRERTVVDGDQLLSDVGTDADPHAGEGIHQQVDHVKLLKPALEVGIGDEDVHRLRHLPGEDVRLGQFLLDQALEVRPDVPVGGEKGSWQPLEVDKRVAVVEQDSAGNQVASSG